MAAQPFSTEEELVRWLETQARHIGDDAAFVEPLRETAITVDSQREGVHFLPGTNPQAIARRLLAVNLSDLAAVGATPHHAVCTLAAPAAFDRRSFFSSLLDACSEYHIELVGGDLSRAPTAECTLTAVGLRQPRGRFLTRDCARVGDAVWLAGALGMSALGLRLLRSGAKASAKRVRLPTDLPRSFQRVARACVLAHSAPNPQLALGQWLGKRRTAIAAIDISDGLLKDASRLATRSGVHLKLDLQALRASVEHPQFQQLCKWSKERSDQLQLTGGEDYALLFTAPQRLTQQLQQRAAACGALRPIGSVVEPPAAGKRAAATRPVTVFHNGKPIDLPTQPGWDHIDLASD